MDIEYHLRREHDHNVLRENATNPGVAAIHADLARLHHDAVEADPGILATIARNDRISPLKTQL